MHDECVAPDAADLALALAETATRHELALGGGTACALRLGHRVSRDLDFFALRALDHLDCWGSSPGSSVNGCVGSRTPSWSSS
jgi:hypothetical protein